MYKIFNSNALNRNQRFLRALILGTVSAVVLGIVYGLFSSTLRIEFSIVYLAIGYANAYVICNYGRGVQTKFSILGAVLTFVSIFIGDMISRFGLGFFGAFNLLPLEFFSLNFHQPSIFLQFDYNLMRRHIKG